MASPSLGRDEDGALVLGDLAPWFVSVLLELPELLEPEQPDQVKRRLYPEPSDDQEQIDEWRKYVHPELFALLASAREVILKDLAGLEPTEEDSPLGAWSLRIPDQHVNAWISALNAARLTLGARHEIEEADMSKDEMEPDAWDDKRMAVAKIHLLGWLQQMIIEDCNPLPGAVDIPDSLPPDVE